MDEINRATYEQIADEFSSTRAYVWKCVKRFLDTCQPNASILEIGCGNGKNMEYARKRQLQIVGIDLSQRFVEICTNKQLDVRKADATNLPFPNSQFNYVMCIAMFHHLLSDDDRNKSFREMLRVLQPDGKGILTCWAVEQPADSNVTFQAGINEVLWKGRKQVNRLRYYYAYTEQMFRSYFESFQEIEIDEMYNEQGNWILLFTKKPSV
jgi:alkylated DNA repair protein alkB family protein 8